MIGAELVGAALFVAGGVAGRYLRVTRKPKAYTEPKPKKPICACSHAFAFHDPKTGECAATVEVMTSSGKPVLDSWGDKVIGHSGAVYDHRPCACKVYTGPEPLPDYYAASAL